jgi:hypothetical protein
VGSTLTGAELAAIGRPVGSAASVDGEEFSVGSDDDGGTAGVESVGEPATNAGRVGVGSAWLFDDTDAEGLFDPSHALTVPSAKRHRNAEVVESPRFNRMYLDGTESGGDGQEPCGRTQQGERLGQKV